MSDVYQQPIAGLTLLAWCCSIGAAPSGNVDFPLDVVLRSLLSHDLSQVHRQGDLGHEVDGMKGDAVELLDDDDGCPERGVPCGHLARHT